MQLHTKSDFDILKVRDTFKKNVLQVKVNVSNRATRRLVKKLGLKTFPNQLNTKTL